MIKKKKISAGGALIAIVASGAALFAQGENGRGQHAVLVSARPSIGIVEPGETRRADGVGVIVAIDAIAPGVAQNGRGEYVFVGSSALVAHLAATDASLVDYWEEYE